MHAATYNIFTVARHLTSAPTHRLFRAEAFATWREAANVAAYKQAIRTSRVLKQIT
jgi:putative transposase